MSSSVSLRVYKITLHENRKNELLPFSSLGMGASVIDFIETFKDEHTASTIRDDRSWYLDEKESGGKGCSKGYVYYGMSGFESQIIDSKTKKKKYDRKVEDSEEIPLFYEFWYPQSGCNYILV